MRRITALFAFILAAVVAGSGLATAPAAAADDDAFATVIDRLEDYYLGQGDDIIIANGIYLARTSEALDYVASQEDDGSWSDVDYADRTSSANGSVWSAYIALYRMLAMTQAYKDPSAAGFGDRTLVEAVDRALLHWDQVDPGNQNWWETEIGESIAMGRISMFLGSELSPEAFQVSLDHNSGRLDPIGANGAWRTSNYLFEALATRDTDRVHEGFATIVATIAVDHSGTVQEAVQPDGSFWAHGAQLYSEGYGMVLFTYAALWADVSRGTDLAFTRDQLDSIAFYIVNGTRWLIRGDVAMLYLNYRPAKTVQGVTSQAAEFIDPLQRMVRTDPLYSTAYQGVLSSILGDTEGNGVTGDKYFWRSEFTSHLRDEYGIFTRLNSSRTFGAELRTAYRDDIGNPVYWNAMGSTAIQVNNHEYLDLGPAFDWNHYPGVTAPYEKRTERGFENRIRNGDGASFTGGVSNGEFSASVLTLDTAGTVAQKSYFTFDGGMVALGAGIASTSGAAVHTTINQASAANNATVGGEPVSTGTDGASADGADWAYNDEVGYVFSGDQDVKVSNKTQTGNWEGEDALDRDAFSLYIDHGTAPDGGEYDYTVLPAATPDEVEAYAAAPTVHTLRNDTDVQAVRNDAGIIMATFSSAGSLELGDGRTLTVDQPGIVLLDDRGETPIVSISNPDRPGLDIGVALTGEREWSGSFALGSGENTGRTVTAALAAAPLPERSGFTASSAASGTSPFALGDGDADSVWYSDGAGTQWVAAHLARGSWVTAVTIDWVDTAASDFIVQTSQNGADWTDQARVTAEEGDVSEIPINPTAAEHVRVLLLGTGGDPYGIRELSITSTVNQATDSATRASGYAGYNLVHLLADGDPETRWRGNNSDSAWAQIDLGETMPVSTVRLSWEAAYAKAYKIQLSDDAENWRDVYTTPSGGSDGGVDVITLDDGQTARFVRMQTVTRALNYGPSIWEFEVFSDRLIADAPSIPGENGNLAQGRPATADSVHNDLANIQPQMATDGSGSTKWSSARADTEHWLQVDLGAVTSVSRAVVAWEAGNSDEYRIEGSVDGETWMSLAEVGEAQPTLTHTLDFAAADVRYVRLTGLPATKYGLNIWELELYGGSNLKCAAPVSTGRDGSAVVVATVDPVDPDDTFTALSMDEQIVTTAGDVRILDDGRVEADLATHEPGRTRVLLRRALGDEVAWCDVTVIADTSGVQAQIDAGNALDSNAYTAETWVPLLPALEHAKDVIAAPGTPQGDVDAAASALGTALAGLVEQDAPPAPDISVKGSMKVGGPINVIGSGFAPGAEYVVELRSPSQVLGTTTVKPNGKLVFHAKLPRDLDAGEYTIVVTRDGADVASSSIQIRKRGGR